MWPFCFLLQSLTYWFQVFNTFLPIQIIESLYVLVDFIFQKIALFQLDRKFGEQRIFHIFNTFFSVHGVCNHVPSCMSYISNCSIGTFS